MTETEKIEGVRANSIEEIRGGVPLEISSYLSCAGSGTVVTIGPSRYLVHYCEEEPGRRSVARLPTEDETPRIAANVCPSTGDARFGKAVMI